MPMTGNKDQGSGGGREPLTLQKAIEAGRKARKKHEPGWRRYRREFTGSMYRQGEGSRRYTNYCYLFASAYAPQLCDSEPTFGVKADQEHTDWITAEAHRLGINKVCEKTKLFDEYRLCVLDSFYAFGFGKTGLYADTSYMGGPESSDPGNYYDDAGSNEDPLMPFFQRISPFDAIWDDMAEHPSEWNYAGHEFRRDRDAVLNDPRYDLSGLGDSTADGWTLMDGTERQRIFGAFEGDIPPFFKLVELWVRPTNTLYTLLETSHNEFAVIRKVPFYGKRWCGPFKVLGYIYPPGKSIPLSPWAAWADQYIELELNEMGANEEAKAEKRFVNFETGDGEAAQIASQVKNHHIAIGAGGGTEVQWGGVTKERLEYNAHERQHLERSSGVSDLNLGMSDSSGTATGAAIVNSRQNSRIRDMQQSCRRFVCDIADDFKWYIHNEPTIKMNVTLRGTEGMPSEYELIGGPQIDPVSGAPVPNQPGSDAFKVYLDDGTLFPRDEATERMQFVQSFQMVTTSLMPLLQMQGSTLNAVSLLQAVARKLNWRDLDGMLIPISPMGMMLQQAANNSGVPGDVTTGMAQTSPGAANRPQDVMQQAAQNQPQTKQANSNSAKQASPHRQAHTPKGANNKETSPFAGSKA